MQNTNKEALLDLLRTNSVNRFLVRRSTNRYIGALRELLNSLGFGNELQFPRLGASDFFGEETASAVRAFATRNRLNNDGLAVTPALLQRMLMRLDAVEGIQLLQRSLRNRQLDMAFNLNDPNNFGVKQLSLLLENYDIYEADIRNGLNEFARQRNIPTLGRNQALSDSIARALLDGLTPCYGEGLRLNDAVVVTPPTPLPTPPPRELQITLNTASVVVTDGTRQIEFRRHTPVGVSTRGFHAMERFIDANTERLRQLDLTPSAISVMKAVSQNEGWLDGINTYDRGFLSVGIYQWTLGRDDRAGELPALLKKVKAIYPAVFDAFFQAFGIDVSDDTNTTYGFLTFNNALVTQPFQKDMFREPGMAYRFWRAAQEPDVQAIQIEHALSRLKNFYWKDNITALGFTLNQIITSSYGVALLLDNHVNRPAWVARCVEIAMSDTGLTSNPGQWTDQDELRLINRYLEIRETYTDRNEIAPMTASRKRAENILLGVRMGWLSDRRGSFQMSNDVAMRSSTTQPIPLVYDTLTAKSIQAGGGAPPPFYSPKDYPDIEMDDIR